MSEVEAAAPPTEEVPAEAPAEAVPEAKVSFFYSFNTILNYNLCI